MTAFQEKKATVLREMNRWLEVMDAAANREAPLASVPPRYEDRQRILQAIEDASAATRTRRLVSIVRNIDVGRRFGSSALAACLEHERGDYDPPLTLDELHEEGELVFENRSEAGAVLVYQYENRFHKTSDEAYVVGSGQPDLEDILFHDHFLVGSYTRYIRSSRLSREVLIERLEIDEHAEPGPIEVNGEVWSPPPSPRTVREDGNVVFQLLEEDATGLWGYYVYRYDDEFYTYDMAEDRMDGPYHLLNDALWSDRDRFLTVTPATNRVESSELSYEELSGILLVSDAAYGPVPPESITVNERRWPPDTHADTDPA